LKDHSQVVPVTKTLLLDLGQLPGLPKELVATALDNFEGMTFGPRLPDGRATLLLVSDDNFRNIQRTWFLALAIQ
jgi:3-phytase